MGDAASCVCADGGRQEQKNGEDEPPSPEGYRKPASEADPAGRFKGQRNGTTPRATPRYVTPREALEAATAKRSALVTLEESCKSDDPDPDAIERAIAHGRAAGLQAAELREASEAAQRAARRRSARAALAEAMASREEEALRRAVGLADEAHLDAREMEGALALIEAFEGRQGDNGEAMLRQAAVVRLEKALQTRSLQDLTDAIAEAEKVGLGVKSQRALLAEARVTLKMVLARRQAAQERRAREEALEAAGGVEGKKTQCQSLPVLRSSGGM